MVAQPNRLVRKAELKKPQRNPPKRKPPRSRRRAKAERKPEPQSKHKPEFNPTSEWLSTAQLAAETDTSIFLWRKRRVDGNGPLFVRLGHKSVRYRRTDVESWLATRTVRSTSDPGQEEV